MTFPQHAAARRALAAAALLAGCVLAGCGDDDDSAGTRAEATAAATTSPAKATVPPTSAAATSLPASTSPVTSSEAATTAASISPNDATTAPAGGRLTAEEADIATVYRTVFDSTVAPDEKVSLIEDGEALRPTIESYATAGDTIGGIQLEPTAVTIDGATAAVTYDVLFAGTVVYEDLDGAAVNDSGWKVTREKFCGFMAQAQNPCP